MKKIVNEILTCSIAIVVLLILFFTFCALDSREPTCSKECRLFYDNLGLTNRVNPSVNMDDPFIASHYSYYLYLTEWRKTK